jgi:hypothetical protein
MAANPFTLIAIGIAALVTGLAVAYTKFEGFRNVVNSVINGVVSAFEYMANSYIKAINLIIKGINMIKPGSDLGFLSEISLGRIGGGGGGATSGGQAREGGTGSITPSLPTMPSLPPAIIGGGLGGGGSRAGGGGGGGGGGIGAGAGDLVTIQGGLTTFGNAERIAARSGSGVTINVTGGMSTSAEIGQSVLNSLLAYQRTNGPLDLQIAS